MEQGDRIRELDRFKAGEVLILVASDVAARGLDVPGVSHVVNYDVPHHAEDYVHRIGRTGRAGRTGIAYTIATEDEAENLREVEKLIGHKIPRHGAVAAGAPAEIAEVAEVIEVPVDAVEYDEPDDVAQVADEPAEATLHRRRRSASAVAVAAARVANPRVSAPNTTEAAPDRKSRA